MNKHTLITMSQISQWQLAHVPLLIKELIGWYTWRRNIDTCNKEYKASICFRITIYGETIPEFHGYSITERRLHCGTHRMDYGRISNDFFIKKRSKEEIVRVALLPKGYFYTSGSHNPTGYNDTISYNTWLPNFIR